MKIDFKNVALVCVECRYDKQIEALQSIDRCTQHADFGEVLFFTSGRSIQSPYKISIEPITSLIQYSDWVLNKMYKHIQKQDYVMIVQWDSYIANPEAWTNEFLMPDYIGAPWHYEGDNVGNGGFSLRSKALINYIKDHPITLSDFEYPYEDVIICRDKNIHHDLVKAGFNFAPEELAHKFSWEKNKKYPEYEQQFGYHGKDAII